MHRSRARYDADIAVASRHTRPQPLRTVGCLEPSDGDVVHDEFELLLDQRDEAGLSLRGGGDDVGGEDSVNDATERPSTIRGDDLRPGASRCDV